MPQIASASEQVNEQGQNNGSSSDAKSREIRTVFTRTITQTFTHTSCVTSLPHQGDMDGNATVGSWRSRRTQRTSFTSGNTAHLTFVNVTHSVTTWGWSAKSVDGLLTSSYGHAPSRVDLFDFAPANEMATEWINNFQTRVGKNEARLDEGCVVGSANNNGNQDACQNGFGATLVAARPDVESSKEFDENRNGYISTSTKNFSLTFDTAVLHNTIFPQVSEVLS